MKILYNSKQIKASLKKVCPTKIAVAYIGKDFKKYIDPQAVESIIISPTLGSNPMAIGELQEIIGWEKILFKGNLHAKFYIGKDYAIVGSANLTNNALGAKGLVEVCIELDRKRESSAFNELIKFFERISNEVKNKTVEEKKNMLQELHIKWRSLIPTVDGNGETQFFDKYSIEKKGIFYLVWYEGTRGETKAEAYEKMYGEEWESCIDDEIDVAVDDIQTILPKNWVLIWKKRITVGEYAYKKPGLRWIYVHRIIKNASGDINYPHALVQESDTATLPVPPFEIDEKFSKSFFKVINRDEFSLYRTQCSNIWHAKETLKLFESFVEELRKEHKAP